MKRLNISSDTIWEEIVGYSRAVRVGNMVKVAGTTAVASDEIQFPGQAYEQALYIFQKIEKVLNEAGATLEDVVRTRMYVTNLADNWEDVGKAHALVFSKIKPVATMVGVLSLIHADLVVEIEVEAMIING